MNFNIPIEVGISPRGVGPGLSVKMSETKKVLTRQAVHDFIESLIAGHSITEQLAILKDVMVDDICYFGILEDGTKDQFSTLQKDTMELIKNPAMKIQAIKEVRTKTGLGLFDAKNYVEALTPGHPSHGNGKYLQIGADAAAQSGIYGATVLTENMVSAMKQRLNRIAKEYGKEPPFKEI